MKRADVLSWLPSRIYEFFAPMSPAYRIFGSILSGAFLGVLSIWILLRWGEYEFLALNWLILGAVFYLLLILARGFDVRTRTQLRAQKLELEIEYIKKNYPDLAKLPSLSQDSQSLLWRDRNRSSEN